MMKWYGQVLRREEVGLHAGKKVMVMAVPGKRRRGQESDGDGGAGEKKERHTKAAVGGYYQERLVGERIVRGGSVIGPIVFNEGVS